MSRSFAGQSAIGQTASAAIGFTLGTMTEVATQTGIGADDGKSRYQVFGYGGYDTDPAASGTLGIIASLSDKIVAGALVSANAVRTDMVYDGKAKMAGASAGRSSRGRQNAGLQWLFSIAGIRLRRRHARLPQRQFAGVLAMPHRRQRLWRHRPRRMDLRPGAARDPNDALRVLHLDAHEFWRLQRNRRPVPDAVPGFLATPRRSRASARHPPHFYIRHLGLGHARRRPPLGSTPSSINGTIIGLFDQTAPAAPVAKEWAEATAGLRWQTWRDGAINASVTAVIPANYHRDLSAAHGFSQRL